MSCFFWGGASFVDPFLLFMFHVCHAVLSVNMIFLFIFAYLKILYNTIFVANTTEIEKKNISKMWIYTYVPN